MKKYAFPLAFLISLGHSASSNSCFVSYDHYLGLGTSQRLVSHIDSSKQEFKSTIYEYDSVAMPKRARNDYLNYGLNEGSTGINDIAIESGWLDFSDKGVLISRHFLGANFRLDSVVYMQRSGAYGSRYKYQAIGDTLLESQYWENGVLAKLEIIIHNDSGAIRKWSTLTDTCRARGDTCFCESDRSEGNYKYVAVDGRMHFRQQTEWERRTMYLWADATAASALKLNRPSHYSVSRSDILWLANGRSMTGNARHHVQFGQERPSTAAKPK